MIKNEIQTDADGSEEHQILPIGIVLQVDDEGYIVSQSSPDKIVAPWDAPVADIRDAYSRHLGDKLHSLYIRGSVGRGNAIDNVSDIDGLAVLHGNPGEVGWSWQREVHDLMGKRYPFMRGVDISSQSYERIVSGERKVPAFLIKTMSACVFGQDLAQQLPGVRLGKDAFIARWGIEDKVSPDYLADNVNITTAQKMKWSAKQILRAGFEMVMEEEGVYTRDLYPCYEIFSKHYPDMEPIMHRALEMAIWPTNDEAAYKKLLADMGPWLVAEINRKYPRAE